MVFVPRIKFSLSLSLNMRTHTHTRTHIQTHYTDSEGWFFGTSQNSGMSGLYPGNYVEKTKDSDCWTLHRYSTCTCICTWTSGLIVKNVSKYWVNFGTGVLFVPILCKKCDGHTFSTNKRVGCHNIIMRELLPNLQ